jgi:predicted TIM-barrel fold metal-dependent hydrolase
MVAAMRDAGVDKALLVSPWSLYRADASYAIEVRGANPDIFRVVAPIDPYDEGAIDAATAWADTPGVAGIRLMAGLRDGFRPDHAEVRAVMRAAEAANWPVCVFCPAQPALLDELALRYPGTQFILDHLGLNQPLEPPPPAEPFAGFGEVLTLARHANVAVKVTAACVLSRRPFPFDDLWEPLDRLFDAFGIERCMWGTDWTRTVPFVTYPESVAAFADHLPLSPGDRAALMGGVVEQIFRW